MGSPQAESKPSVEWWIGAPFLMLHVACLAVFVVGFSWTAFWLAAGFFFLRVFALTAFYHRYFSHRAFKTSRWFQFLGGFLGTTAIQRGPIWWAAHHRGHHQHSDREGDVHSPHLYGFWWSHTCWFLNTENLKTAERAVPDLLKYPELRWLDRFHLLGPVLVAAAAFASGELLRAGWPELGTSGWQFVVWCLLSTVLLFHVTYSVNSIAHTIGRRRFETKDQSRNNWLLALLTFGEGWHNNHHHYPNAARQGFYWWEVDVTYYVLVALSWLGLVWDLKPVPERVLAEGQVAGSEA